MFKKGDFNGNEVSMRIGRVATVTALKAGITKENALRGLNIKFILARSEYVTIKITSPQKTLRNCMVEEKSASCLN